MSDTQIRRHRNDKVVIFKRQDSKQWHARVKIDKGWKRFSTGEISEKVATEKACAVYDRMVFRKAEGLSSDTVSFRDVCELTIEELKYEMKTDIGRDSYIDYIRAIKKYFLTCKPLLHKNIDTIGSRELYNLDQHRIEILGRIPAKSTLMTHNTALHRVFKTAIKNGWMNKSQLPLIENKGARQETEIRPFFTLHEYVELRDYMKEWNKPKKSDGLGKKTIEMRELLYDYYVFLANAGCRPGVECLSIKWKHLSIGWKDGKKFYLCRIRGKVGSREIVLRQQAIYPLQNIQKRFPLLPELKRHTEEELFKVNEYVFRDRSGNVPKNLGRAFRKCLVDSGMLEDSQGQERSLYSIRHMYATLSLSRKHPVPVHMLARQMGTSIQMIEAHYSHLIPSMHPEMFAFDGIE